MNDWIWLAAMLMFGLQTFIIGTTINPETWGNASWRAFWYGFTHPFGSPVPPWLRDGPAEIAHETFDRPKND